MPRHPDLSVPAGALPASIFVRLVERLAGPHGEIFPFPLGDTHMLPPVRLETLGWAAAGHLYSYSPPAGEPALIDDVVRKLTERNGIRARPSQLQITCGATHAFYLS